MSRSGTHGVVPAVAGALAILAGCDSIGQSLEGMAEAMRPKTPGEAAREMVDPHDPDKRREGTLLIANSPFGGGEVYVRAYRDMVQNEPDPIVRAVAIRALGRHGQPDDARLVARHLESEHEQVRWEAAKALQRLHYPAVVPQLLKTMREEDGSIQVRVAAASALGQYPQDRVVQGLVGALDDRALSLNLAAMQSLQALTGQSLGLDPRDWLAWYEGASAAGTAFAMQQEYRFPTYRRDRSWMEKLAFWSSQTYEQPGVPIGLRPDSERRTYEDAEPAPDAGG
ncbi:MAG: HEAT repeat domain-containing protein [Planctomycetota bacterium]|jgi:hypothetical protein